MMPILSVEASGAAAPINQKLDRHVMVLVELKEVFMRQFNLLRCPGASSPSSALSNLNTILFPAWRMCVHQTVFYEVNPTFFIKETASLTFFGGLLFIFRILSFFFSPKNICFLGIERSLALEHITSSLRVPPRHETRHKDPSVLLGYIVKAVDRLIGSYDQRRIKDQPGKSGRGLCRQGRVQSLCCHAPPSLSAG